MCPAEEALCGGVTGEAGLLVSTSCKHTTETTLRARGGVLQSISKEEYNMTACFVFKFNQCHVSLA